jgi:2-phosphoglycerate kinase
LLLGGASGTGKTSVSYDIARRFGVGITEMDDLHLAVEALTTPEQQPALHYWRTHPEAVDLSPEEIIPHFFDMCRALGPAFKVVVANHIEYQTPIVLEGDYLLPEMLAEWKFERAKAVFLLESDEEQLVRNYAAREPKDGEQRKRAQVSRLHSVWLKEECERLGLVALEARPWATLIERIVKAVS